MYLHFGMTSASCSDETTPFQVHLLRARTLVQTFRTFPRGRHDGSNSQRNCSRRAASIRVRTKMMACGTCQASMSSKRTTSFVTHISMDRGSERPLCAAFLRDPSKSLLSIQRDLISSSRMMAYTRIFEGIG
mmetsp:Transcript_4107/g.12349  ORF Transcript_4107/g.12349 Transcript_4107/m.12349 type:complete len:132 (-) Transcript_4107:1017-1412(-)